jgi:hypothetical protein
MTGVPWRDKAGVMHAWLSPTHYGQWSDDNEHAGWYTARAPCGASRRLRGDYEGENRRRDAVVDCMTCLIREGERSHG